MGERGFLFLFATFYTFFIVSAKPDLNPVVLSMLILLCYFQFFKLRVKNEVNTNFIVKLLNFKTFFLDDRSSPVIDICLIVKFGLIYFPSIHVELTIKRL
jgi:hypothetical protein